MDKVIEKILKEVADEKDVPIEEVNKIHLLPYKMMRDTIGKLEIKGKGSEDIDGIKSNFNMPRLFKLYLDKWVLNKLNTKNNDKID